MDLNYAKWDRVVEEVSAQRFRGQHESCYRSRSFGAKHNFLCSQKSSGSLVCLSLSRSLFSAHTTFSTRRIAFDED